MAAGLPTGRAIPGLDDALDSVKVAGLLVMMYPGAGQGPLQPARPVTGDRCLLVPSLDLPVRPAAVPHRVDQRHGGASGTRAGLEPAGGQQARAPLGRPRRDLPLDPRSRNTSRSPV
ncbi:hypothetical protein [Actinomadura formosensis]|uniref:hypothetical protein n=1 Tax=Actinomadura formosensis TaxID=60706 RepID=UPI000B2232D4|nr:hypothetical protein [Actinomadura formosensis]